MRYLFTYLLLVTICASTLKSQHYQTYRSDRTYHYTYQNSMGRYLSFDSLKTGPDTLLFPFSNIWEINYSCKNPIGGSWIGKKVLIGQDGYDVFFNENGDSIKIKKDALINESWTVFKLPGIKTVTAMVSNHDTLSFLGVTDSVKTIQFMVYDPSMSPVNHSLNNMELLLSKDFGLVKTMNFLLFPDSSGELFDAGEMEFDELLMTGIDNPELGVQNLDIFDIYDFQPGDEIHVLEESINHPRYHSEFSLDEITKLRYTYIDRQNYLPDSIVYQLRIQRNNHKKWVDSSSTSYSDDTVKSVIISDATFARPAGSFIHNSREGFTYESDGSVKVYPIIHQQLEKRSNNCWSTVIADGCFSSMTYKKGLGGPYHWCENTIECCYEGSRELVYYKIGGIEWGNPYVGISQVEYENHTLKLFPNPASSVIQIEADDFSHYTQLTIIVYDLQGRRLHHEQNSVPGNGILTINLSKLPAGSYIIQLINDQRLRTGKLSIVK